jgi:hypothetical protein
MRCAIIGCLLAVAQLGFASAGFSCDYPDEGRMPLRRAVTRVELLPEVDAWARAMQKDGVLPQYVVRLDAPVKSGRLCYWPVEVHAGGQLWRRYLVTPDGKFVKPHD